jgi:hypothetical protein
MRKLKIIEHISLDGVIQVSRDDGDFPYGDWTAPYRSPAGRDEMPGRGQAATLRAAETITESRKTLRSHLAHT